LGDFINKAIKHNQKGGRGNTKNIALMEKKGQTDFIKRGIKNV